MTTLIFMNRATVKTRKIVSNYRTIELHSKKTSKQEMSLAEMTFYCFRDCADWVVCPLERGGG